MNIIQALDDPNLFKPWIKDAETWTAWRSFLAALFGLPMTDEELAIFHDCTGRDKAPSEAAREAWLIVGRRGGKSFTMALTAVFLAAFKDYREFLQPGEKATVLVIAADRKQARTIMRYASGLLNEIPLLKAMVERETLETFELDNRSVIEVHTANFRTVRGYTIPVAICDEIAFWRSDESASPDKEVLNAIRPAMLTIPNAMLLCASSPYSRRGVLWEARQNHYAREGKILVWQAPTRRMNPAVPQDEIDAKYAEDPASAASEYGAEFRSDLQSFVDREALMACVEPTIKERPYDRRWYYCGFVDPSGGSKDGFTLAIAHREGKTVVLDAVREILPPFQPSGVVEEYAALLKAYRLTAVTGDRYAGEWPREQFRERGVTYKLAPKSRSEMYRDILPLVNSGLCALLDNTKMLTQFATLERRTGTRGDTIDHPPGGHDDIANAAAGAIDLAWMTDGRERREIPLHSRKPRGQSDPLAMYR